MPWDHRLPPNVTQRLRHWSGRCRQRTSSQAWYGDIRRKSSTIKSYSCDKGFSENTSTQLINHITSSVPSWSQLMSGNFTAPKRVPPELVKSSIIKMWSCIRVSRWRWAPSFTHQQLWLFTVWLCIFTIQSMKKCVFLYLIALSSFQGFCCSLSLNDCIVSDSKRIAGLLDFVWCILRTRELVKIAYTMWQFDQSWPMSMCFDVWKLEKNTCQASCSPQN